jgi:hypothetical protein
MGSRLPSWVLLVYVAIDLANPFVPGAFQFTPEEGLVWVEGTSPSREGAGAGTSETRRYVPVPPRVASDGSLLVPGEPTRAGYLTAWLVRVRTGDPPARDLPLPESDDH